MGICYEIGKLFIVKTKYTMVSETFERSKTKIFVELPS